MQSWIAITPIPYVDLGVSKRLVSAECIVGY